jgi:carboxypeptidase family protein
MSLSKHSSRVLIFAVCSLFLVAVAIGQFRAGIEGTVTDSTGAAVKDAKITVTNQETGASQELITSDTGFYSAPHLPPGKYTVTVTLTNFKTKVVKDIDVSAESVQAVNLTIEPGTVTEQVTVSGNTLPTLQTEEAGINGTITDDQITRLPEVGRDPYELVRLAPGVFGTGSRNGNGNSTNLPNYSGPGGSNNSIFQTENAVQVSANGQRVEANGFSIDGVSVNSQAWGGAAVITPNEESVKEIKVESNTYSAENGRYSGALVEVVSQNGTNNFHGSFVFKLHSPGLNAFQRWGGPNGALPQKDETLLRNYAGSLGGPIWKNKVFGFFSFEHISTHSFGLESEWIETPQFIQELDTARPNSIAAKIFAVPGNSPKIANQLTSTCAALLGTNPNNIPCANAPNNGGVILGSFTGAPGQIVTTSDGGGITPGDTTPQFEQVQVQEPSGTQATQYNARVDFQVTQKDLVAFSMYYTPVTNTFVPGSWCCSARQYDFFTSARHHEAAALLWNRTISSTVINEARFNVTRWYFNEVQSNTKIPWGVPNNNINIPNNSFHTSYPGPGWFYQTSYNFRDALSKVHNSHVLKFGGELVKEQNNDVSVWGDRPAFDFNNVWSFGNDAPTDQQTATYDPKTGALTDFRKYVRVNDLAFFGQDNWKFRPNLTLSLGLRWEYLGPLHDKYGKLSNIVLGTGANTLTGASIKIGGNLSKPDYNNFGPQLSFAWSPGRHFGHDFNNKVVWRGGFGLGFNRIPESLTLQARSNPPSFIASGFSASQIPAGVYTINPNGIHAFYGFPPNPNAIIAFDPTTNIPLSGNPSINGPLQDMRTPYTFRYSLEGQYDFGHSWVAALGYQGSQSRKFPRTLNYSLLFPPNPHLGIVNIFQSDVNANYNALLARITHRFSRGLEFNANYRWSKSLDLCSSDQNCEQTYPFDQTTEHGPSDFDVTHSLTAYALYDLPFFRSTSDWKGKLIGGWQVNGILTLNSGFPWTPVSDSGSSCASSVNAGFICPVRPVAYKGGAGTNYSTDNFKTTGNFPGGGLNFFTPPVAPPGGYLVPPLPGVGRNSFRGPRYTGFDMSVAKRFGLPKLWVIGEGAGIDLRANLFNVFNKLNLSPFGFHSDSTTIERPLFGRATSALAGRVVEFQARFHF